VRTPEELQRFERLVMPHLGAGYNLARWLARNDHDADDIVQEAYLRAVRSFDRFRGGDPRAWILTIVRNTCYSWLEKNRTPGATSSGDADEAVAALAADASTQPEVQVLREADRHLVRDAPTACRRVREVPLLREVEFLPARRSPISSTRPWHGHVASGNGRDCSNAWSSARGGE
jgi:RNA polymerase sigma-70 factor (ECF subfamily)